MKPEISRLNLVSPIYYIPLEKPDPFGCPGEAEFASGGEKLFCFELDKTQYSSFDPDKEKLLGTLVCGGKTAGQPPDCVNGAGKNFLELPRGNYLFVQKREILCRDEIIALAVEIQQEGLWQRLKPGEKLYLRFLYEDGSGVTQLFRQYETR